jgi:hypothetical protein
MEKNKPDGGSYFIFVPLPNCRITFRELPILDNHFLERFKICCKLNMKKIGLPPLITLIALFSTHFTSLAQDFPFLAKNSAEFLNPKQDTTIEDVYINSNFKVIVKTKNGTQKYKEYNVWGFGDDNGRRYRIYNEKDYEIRQISDLVIYRRSVSSWIYTKIVYYFSKGIDGDIYGLTWASLKEVFSGSNPAFLKLVRAEIPPAENYWQYDKKNKSFKIIELYQQSIR